MKSSKKKVLIIDDEADLCLLLKHYLQRKDFEVYISHTLIDGLSSFRSLRPDMVFLDNNLPDGYGWDVAPRMAAQAPGVKINLMTAFQPKIPAMPDNANVSILEKPVSMRDIGRLLE